MRSMRIARTFLAGAAMATSLLSLAHADAWDATFSVDTSMQCHRCSAVYSYSATTGFYDPGTVTTKTLDDGRVSTSTSFKSANGLSFGRYEYQTLDGNYFNSFGYVAVQRYIDDQSQKYDTLLISLIGFADVKPLGTQYLQSLLAGQYDHSQGLVGLNAGTFNKLSPVDLANGLGSGGDPWTTVASFKDLAPISPVPEPGILAMMLAGMAVMVFMARRPQRALAFIRRYC